MIKGELTVTPNTPVEETGCQHSNEWTHYYQNNGEFFGSNINVSK